MALVLRGYRYYVNSSHASLNGCANLFIKTRKMSTLVNFDSKNSKGDCPGYFTKKNSTKGLVVIQEWWGLNTQIKKLSETISDKGNLTTIAPDLYRGNVAIDHETAGHLMNDLDWPGAISDIYGAAAYLLSQGCNKVGVVGYCMGGALTLASAALNDNLSAAAPFYGIPPKKLADPCKITIPLQCHFAEKDILEGFSSPVEYNKLKSDLEMAGVKFEFFTYDAGHGFVNEENPLGNYNEKLRYQALDRVIEFMSKHLA